MGNENVINRLCGNCKDIEESDTSKKEKVNKIIISLFFIIYSLQKMK